jgi:radical SAM superfamily enzyme YgiQ (UPF0313 family)
MGRSIRKIVFVEPSSTHLHVYSRVTIPRLGSVLLATIMRDLGYEVRVYIEDITPIDMDEVLSADLVGISTLTSTAPPSYRLSEKVREAGIPTVLGGSHVTFMADEAIQYGDYVVRGEGEFVFVDLVEALENGKGFEEIQNLSYLDGDKAVHNPERPKIDDLDVTPIPDYSLIEGWKRGGIASINTSRGCPFPCTFCSVPGMYGRSFRTHSIDRTIEDLRLHKDAEYIFFADDIFNANPKRMKALLRRMIDEGLTIQWGAQIRTEAANDPELLELMRASNCFNVYVGFESINPRTLELFNKKQDLAKIERSIEQFHKHKIRIHGMFVVGSDEDDVETLHATTDFAKSRDLESVQFLIMTPCPGSPDWDNVFERGDKYIISKDWSLYDGHHTVHQPKRMTPYELQITAYHAMKNFYSWGGIIKKALQGDIWTAGIRLYGKRLMKDWWRDERNQAYVEQLRRDISDAAEQQVQASTVGIPDVFIQEGMGTILHSFLGELGLKVIPIDTSASECESSLADTLHRWRHKADCVILPVVKKAEEGKEGLYRTLNALHELFHINSEKLPHIVHFPFFDGQAPVFESFAKVGLAFTGNVQKVRNAFLEALNAIEPAASAEGQTA